jgi:hypothetical protein
VFAKFDFCAGADVVFGFFESGEEGGDGLTINLYRLEQWPAFGGDPIDATVSFVPVRIAHVVLHVADEESLLAERLEQQGLPCPIRSAGGTATWEWTATYPGITEIQAGTYVMMESDLDGLHVRLTEGASRAGMVSPHARTCSAAEVCIALSLILWFYRKKETVNVEEAKELKG